MFTLKFSVNYFFICAISRAHQIFLEEVNFKSKNLERTN